MLTKRQIFNYHFQQATGNIRGFEYEIFCLNSKYKRLFYNKDDESELDDVFNYLISEEIFKMLDAGKTIGLEKGGAKFTLEPGSQLEYSSNSNESMDTLIEEFLKLLELYKVFIKKFDLKLTDFSLFPFSTVEEAPFISAERYKIMSKYFHRTGTHGKVMMKHTTSLQLTFSYESREDLERKVNRLLLIKPVLLSISSNSRIYEHTDTKYRSFREMVWNDTDPKRCGDPGKDFWSNGKWTIVDYIEKVLDAPVIFDVAKKQYLVAPAKPFRNLIDKLDIDSYMFHNSTMFTDIRIKNYIEMRYLDNPTILLVPGIMLLIESLLTQDGVWKQFSETLPYKFNEVPSMTKRLNLINKESLELWDQNIRPSLLNVIDNIKQNYSKKKRFYLNTLREKIQNIDEFQKKEIILQNFVEDSVLQFNNNLAKLLTNK